MMTNTERELRRRIEEAGFEAITVTMKCNGDKVTITPCGYGAKSFDDIEYYLLDSPTVNLCGRDTLAEVAEVLLGYADRIREDEEAVEGLKAHIRKYGYESDWDFVSDFHKDLFGHRPHVGADRLIRWAYSDSKESARLA